GRGGRHRDPRLCGRQLRPGGSRSAARARPPTVARNSKGRRRIMTSSRSKTPLIRAVVSDVDGTLVTSDKALTKRAIAAAAELRRRCVPFTIISSRPPRGMSMLLAPLQISLPIAAFNGGVIATPDLNPISEHLIPKNVAHRVVSFFQGHD